MWVAMWASHGQKLPHRYPHRAGQAYTPAMKPKEIRIQRRHLGRQLAAYRRATHVTQVQLAAELRYGRTSITHVEAGRQSAPRSFWMHADNYLAAGGKLLAELDAIEHLRTKHHQEQRAASTNSANTTDQAQLPYIAKALTSTTDRSAHELEIIASSHAPAATPLPHPRLAAVPQLTQEGLQQHMALLQSFATLDSTSGPRTAFQGATAQLHLLEEAVKWRPTAELLHVTARFAELAGWLAQDIGDYDSAWKWSSDASDYAVAVGDTALSSYIAMRRSNIATDAGAPMKGLILAEGALRSSTTGDLRALALRQKAAAHALTGDEREVARAAELAIEAATHEGDTSGLAPYLSISYLKSEAAAAWIRCERFDRALELLTEALHTWPDTDKRDRGIGLSRLARTHVLAGNLTDACNVGSQAVAAVTHALSARALEELRKLQEALPTSGDESKVHDLRNLLNTVIAS